MPILVINNGKILNKNLRALEDDEDALKEFLKNNGANLKNTEVLTVDGNGRAYLQRKNQKFIITKYPIKESARW